MSYCYSIITCAVSKIVSDDEYKFSPFKLRFETLAEADLESLIQLRKNIITGLYYYVKSKKTSNTVSRVFLEKKQVFNLEQINNKIDHLKLKNPELFI